MAKQAKKPTVTKEKTPKPAAASPAEKVENNPVAQKRTFGPIIVWLEVFAPAQSGGQVIPDIVRSESGEIMNETQRVKLLYQSFDWENYLENLPNSPWVKARAEKAFELVKKEYKELEEIPPHIAKEVERAFHKIEEVELTADQKKIKVLEAKIEKLTAKIETEE